MEIQSLIAFRAVAERGSFSLAAEQLHLTQPAVSKRVALLEERLDVKLFDRIGRSVTLTDYGRALLPKAIKILQEVKAAETMMDELAGEVGGRLSIATSHHIGLHRLPTVLRQFVSRYPNVTLDLDFFDSDQAYQLVLQGNFDLAITTLSPLFSTQVESRVVWDDPLDCVVSPQHVLSKKHLELADLSEFPAILPKANTYTGKMMQKLFTEKNLPLSVALSTNYLETIKMMVSIGLGWSWLPRTLVDEQLQTVDVKNVSLCRQLGVVWHKERSLSNAAQAMVDLLSTEI